MFNGYFIYNVCAWQHYVADGVIILGLLAFGLLAAKKGFVRCFFGFISTILSLAVAFLFMNAVIGWTDGLFGLQTWFNEACVNALDNVVGFDVDISAGGIAAALEGKLPDFLITLIVDSVADQTLPQGTTVAMVAGEALGGVVTGFVACVIYPYQTPVKIVGKTLFVHRGKFTDCGRGKLSFRLCGGGAGRLTDYQRRCCRFILFTH